MPNVNQIREILERLYKERNKYAYFYGAKGQVLTDAVMDSLIDAQPAYFNRYNSSQIAHIKNYSRGKIGMDCSAFACYVLELAGVIQRKDWIYSAGLFARCKNVTTDVNNSDTGTLLYSTFHGSGRHIGINGGYGYCYDMAVEGDTIRKYKIADYGKWEKAGYYPNIEYGAMPTGFLDEATPNHISGWAWDTTSDPITVHIYIRQNGKVVALFPLIANRYREDLRHAGIGNGQHGFATNYDFSKHGVGTYEVTAYAINPDGSNRNPQLVNTKTVKVVEPTYKTWVGEVYGTVALNVRMDASYNAPIYTPYPSLGYSNLVEVIGEKKSPEGHTWYKVRIAAKHVGYVHSDFICDTQYPHWVGKVITTTVPVYRIAGKECGTLKEYPQLGITNLVDVIGEIHKSSLEKWYKIRIAGKYIGYVETPHLSRA